MFSRRLKSTKPVVESEVSVELPGCPDPLRLSFGKLARFADGSCVASQGGTSVLVTAVSPSSGVVINTSDLISYHFTRFTLGLISLVEIRAILLHIITPVLST